MTCAGREGHRAPRRRVVRYLVALAALLVAAGGAVRSALRTRPRPAPSAPPGTPLARRPGALYRRAVTRGRWAVVGGWLLLGAAVFTLLPAGHAVGGDAGFSNLLPSGSAALRIEERSLQEFRVPVLSGTTVVVHAETPLTLTARARIAAVAAQASRSTVEHGPATTPGHLVAAVPIPLVARDTAVTYLFLFLSDGTSIWTTQTLANRYARRVEAADGQPVHVSVTGFVPAQVSQGEQLAAALPAFELASVVIITVIVGLTFRSVVAPLAVLLLGGAGYAIFLRVLAGTAGTFGLSVPQQLEPVLAALFIGVITDYCVLLFSAFRRELVRGADRFGAVEAALRSDAPVIAVAGTTVAGGLIALLVSPFEYFKSLGPALALTVVTAALVSLTLTPALMTLLGTRLFDLRGGTHLRRVAARRNAREGRARSAVRAAVHALTTRRGAVAAVLVAVAALGAAASPVLHARLSLSFTAGLPASDPVEASARVLDSAGIRGVTAPLEVLVEGPGVATRRGDLAALQGLIQQQHGVVRVIGPAQNRLTQELGVVLAADGDAARYVVVLDSDPLGATAITDLRRLQARLPALAASAGLADVHVDVTGQTRIASEVAGLTVESLRDTLLAALLIELLVLALALRSLLAPLAVLLCGLLSVGAALGLTVLVFQDVGGQPGLTFYAPFSTAVLLLALGSDYTVFTIGAIWAEARRRPLVDAIRRTLPDTARTVTSAGIILASTFAAVGLVPLTAFRQIAFTMTVGLLLDTLIVRPILTPALLTLLGRAARWPGGGQARTAAPERVIALGSAVS